MDEFIAKMYDRITTLTILLNNKNIHLYILDSICTISINTYTFRKVSRTSQ